MEVVPIAKGKFEYWLTEDGLLCVEGWARDGLIDTQIADKLHIGTTTFYRWQQDYPEFREALRRGKAPVDVMVENALLKKALGYAYTETVTDYEMAETGETDTDGKPVLEKRVRAVRTVQKELPPDVGAAAFWLKNRRPDRWREKREAQIQVSAADYSLIDEAAREIRKAADENPDAE